MVGGTWSRLLLYFSVLVFLVSCPSSGPCDSHESTRKPFLCFFLRFENWNLTGTSGFPFRLSGLEIATGVGDPRITV